jgi:hypothetical protein
MMKRTPLLPSSYATLCAGMDWQMSICYIVHVTSDLLLLSSSQSCTQAWNGRGVRVTQCMVHVAPDLFCFEQECTQVAVVSEV